MRSIDKRPEPTPFRTWKASGNEDWQPTYSDLRQPLKNLVHEALLAEQGWVCCYCEGRVSLDSRSSHIEHLIPQQAADEARALDYANLLASCDTNSVHCGHRKSGRFLPVHPLMTDCANFFEFGSAGTIAPSADGARKVPAREAIDILGLDTQALVARRRQALDDWLGVVAELPADEVRTKVTALLRMDRDGRHLPYATSVVYVVLATA